MPTFAGLAARPAAAGHRQRPQRIGAALQSADPGGKSVDQQGQAEQLGELLTRRLAGELQGAEEQRAARRQQPPECQGDGAWQDALEHPDRDGQQQHAEEVAHANHPGSTLGQKGSTTGGEQHQRRAHAQAQGEQLQPAAHCVAAGADIEQCTGQRSGDARRYQQAGHRAQHRGAGERTAAGAAGQTVEAAAQGLRQAQLEQAEHGQREDHEEQCERHEYPRRLQACLQIQLGTEHAHQCAEYGETAGHRQYIGHRQQEAAHAAGLAAQDHPGEDRQHRQHAWGEGQA